MELSWASVVARRLHRQGLITGFSDVAEAVSAMGGAHAQVMSAAELSLGVRVPDATPETIRAALSADGTLVKTYGPRGTVHLLPRSELPLWCAALSAVPLGSSLPATVTLDSSQLDDAVEAIGETLRTAGALDGDELGAAVVARLGSWADERVVPAFGGWWPRWRLAIQVAAYRGVLAFGDNRGNRVTYLDPGVRPEPSQELALEWLLKRFLATYGPAEPAHYARWLGVRKGWATEQFDRSALEAVSVEGSPAFVAPGDIADFEPLSDALTLLPHFDPYVIGSFPRERVFPGAAATRALGRGQAGVHPVLVVNGVVAGIWTGKRRGTEFRITVEEVDRLSSSQKAQLAAAAARIGEFLDATAVVTFDRVATGAHK